MLEAINAEYVSIPKPVPSIGLYISLQRKVNQLLLFDAGIIEMIDRYNYCKEMNCPAYSGDFNNQPANWIDFCRILRAELPKCEKEYARRVKNG